MDRTSLEPGAAQQVISFAGPAMALLETYDAARDQAEAEEDEPGSYYVGDDEFDVEHGTLVL